MPALLSGGPSGRKSCCCCCSGSAAKGAAERSVRRARSSSGMPRSLATSLAALMRTAGDACSSSGSASSTGTSARAAARGPACTTLIADDRLFSSSGSGSDGEKAKGENVTVWRSWGRLRQAEASAAALSAMCIAQAYCAFPIQATGSVRFDVHETTSPHSEESGVPDETRRVGPSSQEGEGGGRWICREVRDSYMGFTAQRHGCADRPLCPPS